MVPAGVLKAAEGQPVFPDHSYAWRGRPITTRYVDATTVPYMGQRTICVKSYVNEREQPVRAPFVSRLPFRAILKEGIACKNARNRRVLRFHTQTTDSETTLKLWAFPLRVRF
jgi:hypothetical protein